MNKALLDTDILSEVLKKRDPTAGRIFADLELRGRPIGMPDVMIAALALQHGLVLAAGNTAHFEAVRAVGYPLALENWRVS